MNITKLMKQAKKMQETIAALEVDGDAGGGAVKVTMSGAKRLLSVKLDPEAIDVDDISLLEDLILAAVNDAERKAEEAISSQLGGGMPGMPGLPGMF